jgi:hypothetical protein
MYFYVEVHTRDKFTQTYTLLYVFLNLKYISGDELNTYRDLLKEMKAMIYIPTSVRKLRDIAGETYKNLQHLHVILTSNEETQLLLLEVKSYYRIITKCSLQHNVT